MNRKILTKITSTLVVLVLAVVMLFSTVTPSFAEATYSAEYIKQLESIDTNYEQYLDSSVAYKLPDTVRDDDEISIIIKLDDPAIMDAYDESDKSMTITEFALSEAANEIRKNIYAEKAVILSRLDGEDIAYTTGVSYDTVLAGFEILIKAADFEDMRKLLGDDATAIVGEVYNVAETQLVNNKVDYYEETGIFNSSGFAYDGSGVVVAVLDTGIDYTHSAFSVANFTSDKLGLTKEQVAAILGDTEASEILSGLTADDVYLNDKIPFQFDYADKDADAYSLYNHHGTHVSGVILGKDDVITGVAPNAQLVSMKVFSDIQNGARTSWIVAALEDCVTIGVDVINMSLGSACGFSREVDEPEITAVYDKIRDSGISLVVAASNSYSSAQGSEKNGNLGLTSNPDTGTVGSPGTYEGAFSVASINGVKTPYMLYGNTIMYFNEATNHASEEKNFFDEIIPTGKDKIELEYVLIPGAGRAADYIGIDLTGKIALVRRGSNTFEEKANAAYNAGATAIIVFNNVAGDIKMNAGRAKLPICSISQDDGEMLAEAGRGTLVIARDQKSGPFMSDFSSWGPTPDLRIKPEITAHGGNILSAVTGGTYDRLSGTSMACPNTAGVVALMRQYAVENFPNIANDEVAINALVCRLIMSTADIIYNQNGLPYSVRKQGAGLANLTSASTTTAYILTYDRDDGTVMDKSKIELGDDPDKTGIYTLNFSVNNFGLYDLTYDLNAYVMTEGVSDTKTHKGDTTVTQEGYILGGAQVIIATVNGEEYNGTRLTVPAGDLVDVTVQIKLSAADKKYLDDSFENGMYVEGFVRLEAVSGTEVSLGVPYLAFYGDWTKAPLFDLDYFETHADELDDSIETLDKTLPDAYATRPIGGVEEDYINYLGSYYFIQEPGTKIISANRDYVSISNVEGTVHSLRYIWAGLLRNASEAIITITDASTGEVVFETVDYNVRKSYGDGGSIYPASIDIEFDAIEHNLKNNTKYNVKVEGVLNYGDGGGETNEKNTFEFPLYSDFEAPAITGCEFYTEYDRSAKKTRLFAKMDVYDNHYSMAMVVGYISMGTEGYVLNSLETYPTQIYSERDTTTAVVYELTDYIYEIKANAANKNSFVVSCYDYAMNEATYEIPLPDEFRDFYFADEDGNAINEVTLSPNEVYTLNALSYPGTEWPELLEYYCANTDVARIVNNRVVAVAPGVATIIVKSPTSSQTTTFKITVIDEEHPDYVYYDKPVADIFELQGYETIKAYYQLSSEDRDIGSTGDIRMTPGGLTSLKMFPSESVELIYKLDAYFPENVEVVFESSNDSIVSIDENGVIVANEEGYSSVSVRVLLDGQSTYYNETIEIEVKNPYITMGPWLQHYFGNGGTVTIPEDLMLTEIYQYAFSNYEYIPKTEEDEISEEDPNFTKIWYIGDDTIKKVIIPEGVEKIGPYAFANLTALEEVVLPSTLEAIDYGAFYGCVNLKKVEGIENVKLINKEAFYNCNLTGVLELGNAHAVSDYAFAGNEYLVEVILADTLQSIGAYAFEGDVGITSVTIKAESVKYGPYVFSGCEGLTELDINSAVIPAGAFADCKNLKNITIGKDVSTIAEFAFYNTAVDSFTVADGNTSYKAQEDGAYLLSADGTTLVLVAPTLDGKFTLNDSNVKYIGIGAFSANGKITSVEIPSAVTVGNYAFYGCEKLREVKLGDLLHVGNYAFSNTAISKLPAFAEDLTVIGNYAFAFTNITEVNLGDGMEIGEGAFYECKKLARVILGDNVKIGGGAFMLERESSLPDPDNENIPYYLDGGRRVYYYYFKSALKELVIGENADIGAAAFFGASALKSVTLGDNARIGDNAFYNASALTDIDLSKATYIGDLAFSGDVHYVFTDTNYNNVYIKDNYYVFRYYAPAFKSVDISSATYVGKQAFQYCKELEEVKLGEKLEAISAYAFGACEKLETINLDNVVRIDESAFSETALKSITLTNAVSIGKYAFVYCNSLDSVTLGDLGTDIGEGAFAYCESLKTVGGLNTVDRIDSYAFAYSGLVEADLTAAVTVGDHAFIKEELTPFTVVLGEKLETIGDNPFAMCVIAPFSKEVVEEFNGKEFVSTTYDFTISNTVSVIDGSLYCAVPSGLELITYAGESDSANVAEETVRITAMAFAGSDVVKVYLPHTLNSIGHKAFYGCDSLTTVVFKSYAAPILEEEFDVNYYSSLENLPATGDYDFVDYSGKTFVLKGLEIVPYYMWNISDTKYSNVYYGASFVDYIGHNEGGLVMIRPSNGLNYETFIYGQYFGTVIDGAAAMDDTTVDALKAIQRLPESVKLEDEDLVIAAREAYDKIATDLQRALISDEYTLLTRAERRIQIFKDELNAGEPGADETPDDDTDEDDNNVVAVIVVTVVLVLIGVAAVVVRYLLDKKNGVVVPAGSTAEVATPVNNSTDDGSENKDGSDGANQM